MEPQRTLVVDRGQLACVLRVLAEAIGEGAAGWERESYKVPILRAVEKMTANEATRVDDETMPRLATALAHYAGYHGLSDDRSCKCPLAAIGLGTPARSLSYGQLSEIEGTPEQKRETLLRLLGDMERT